MIWTGGAKRRLKDVIGKKVTNFSDLETKREEAARNKTLEPAQPITDEELIPMFYFNFEYKNTSQKQGQLRQADQKLQKVTLSRRLVEASYEDQMDEEFEKKQLTAIE